MSAPAEGSRAPVPLLGTSHHYSPDGCSIFSSPGEMRLLLTQNGSPHALVDLPYAVAKSIVQDLSAAIAVQEERVKREAAPKIDGWGMVVDPDGDCGFTVAGLALVITVPGSRPHDMSPEISRTNAPRVMDFGSVDARFKFTLKVDGRFEPGADSTEACRLSYNGAGIILMADERNFVTVVRAAFQRPGEGAVSYANAEVRVDGKMVGSGNPSAHPVPPEGPVYLSLERNDRQITAYSSLDGKRWKLIAVLDLPPEWSAALQAGAIAVSTSTNEFRVRFSALVD